VSIRAGWTVGRRAGCNASLANRCARCMASPVPLSVNALSRRPPSAPRSGAIAVASA
jgi:hypothetical protein